MRCHRTPTFESLESKRCLAVTAAVTAGGDLLVEGTADGAVEIVAVGAGAYRVSDNGAVVADADVLTGVTDDIRINLEDAADGAVNSVTLNLGEQSVDAVYASLGDGDNSFQLVAGTTERLKYRGGGRDDNVQIGGVIEASVQLKLGDGDNTVDVTSDVGRLTASGGDGDDAFTLAEGATTDRNVKLSLGDGNNTTTIAGAIDGSLSVDGRDGEDFVAIAATSTIADNFFARLGEGENTVTHEGAVEGDFSVVSANEDDTVDIAETAVIGGDTNLGLGEQLGPMGHCHGGGGFGLVAHAGRELGFFFRGLRR